MRKLVLLFCALLLALQTPAYAQIYSSPQIVIPVQPYQGIVSTRHTVPTAIIAPATATWISGRTMRWARSRIVNLSFLEGGCYVNTSNTETCPTGKTSKKSIEYPSGTITQCNGGNAIAVSTATLIPCPEAPIIPDGAQFWERFTDINTTNGPVYHGTQSNNFIAGVDGFQYGTGTPTDYTVSGTPPNSFNLSQGGGSLAIIAFTTKSCTTINGDSKAIGISDYVNDNTGDLGHSRFYGQTMGYANLAVGGTTLAGYLAGSHTMRDAVIALCSFSEDEAGINDAGAGKTAAQIATMRASWAALYPNARVLGATFTPDSTSTDSWATTANQTPAPTQLAFDILEREGIAGEVGVVDVSDAVDPTRAGVWTVSRNVAATTSTVAIYTASIATTGIMTVSAVASGTLVVEANVQGTSVPTGTVITGKISGTGGTGTYQTSTLPNSAITSETMNTGGPETWEGLHESAMAYQLELYKLQGQIVALTRLVRNDLHLGGQIIMVGDWDRHPAVANDNRRPLIFERVAA